MLQASVLLEHISTQVALDFLVALAATTMRAKITYLKVTTIHIPQTVIAVPASAYPYLHISSPLKVGTWGLVESVGRRYTAAWQFAPN